VSDPSPATATPDWQRWQVTLTEPWQAPEAAEAQVRWGPEALVALLVVAYSMVLGGAVGLIWPRVAPHIRLADAIDGSEAATKALLGDDLWLALLGIFAGVLSVALLALIARDAGGGPGGVLGLAIGGLLGSIVAAHVGHLVQSPHILSELKASFPGISAHSLTTIVGYFGFRVRARAVLVAWPVAAVALHAATAAFRYRRLSVTTIADAQRR
jgi:hypothetical protein